MRRPSVISGVTEVGEPRKRSSDLDGPKSGLDEITVDRSLHSGMLREALLLEGKEAETA
jgi:hypothetical protein